MRQSDVYQPVHWLQEAGFTAYLVGNQVRDALLGTTSDRFDVDIATAATPDQVAKVLNRHQIQPSLIDAKFGVTSFTYDGIHFEVTTFRLDIYDQKFAEIRRYPDEIRFIKSAAKDALRRDLTINAIYYNPKTGRYLDYTGGLEDIKNKRIRMVGKPSVRFAEDPIRMLRVVRFKHQLGFTYDPATKVALTSSAHLLAKISPTVIKKEMQKIQALENYPEARIELVRFGFIRTI